MTVSFRTRKQEEHGPLTDEEYATDDRLLAEIDAEHARLSRAPRLPPRVAALVAKAPGILLFGTAAVAADPLLTAQRS